jgi:signal transduction histidine kinase
VTWSELRQGWDRVEPLRQSPRAADLVIVGGTAALEVLSLALVRPTSWPLAIVLAVLQTAPLLWRRRWPLAVLAVLTAASAAQDLVHVHFGGYLIAVPAAIYSVADRSGALRWLVLAFGVAYSLGSGVQGVVEEHDVRGVSEAFPGVVVCTAFILGENARTRRAYLAELDARIARQERDREVELRRAADEERARIARELHDVVTHHVSAIAVQAETHRAVRPDGPDSAVLASIVATARTALDELARLLGVMHGGREGPPPREPEPGLAALDGLVERARAAGVDVRLQVTGAPRPLPAALELSAYRIVQEATTNARKHAAGARVEVSLRYAPDGLHVSVLDDGAVGAAPPQATVGRGLIGMRERVALFGGSLDAGPVPGGGFRVTARLPAE